jgi:hypothetical protein
MPDPVIVPPAPTITQPSAPVDTSPGMEQVQRAFDRAYPMKGSTPPVTTEAPPQAPTEPVKPPDAAKEPAPEVKPPDTTEHKIPSFLEEALKLTPEDSKPKPAAPEPEVEWSEDIAPEEKKSRIKGLRDAYKALKQEVAQLRERPSRDPAEQQRLAQLVQQNRQMSEVLSRVGVEHSAEFNASVIQPLHASWNEAARIVKDAGGDPQELAKAMSLNGRAQFEALDSLFADMPESAKMEAHDALRNYRRFEDVRRNAIANAPKTLEALRARETERQYAQVNKQREDMKGMFDRALARLSDEAKVEVFQKFDKPEAQWWNDQRDKLIAQGRDLFLENTDLDRVALACLLAPAADAYRKLFITSQKKVSELEKLINDRLGGEPNLSESGGNAGNLTPDGQFKDDLKKPFADVFLREFHKSRARNK